MCFWKGQADQVSKQHEVYVYDYLYAHLSRTMNAGSFFFRYHRRKWVYFQPPPLVSTGILLCARWKPFSAPCNQPGVRFLSRMLPTSAS